MFAGKLQKYNQIEWCLPLMNSLEASNFFVILGAHNVISSLNGDAEPTTRASYFDGTQFFIYPRMG